jgi:hypothetical protein
LADYHVAQDPDGTLFKVEGVIPITDPESGNNDGQVLAPQYRAGMITTQWFLATNTMFSALPRTTAAQAYRSYLGADIARQQGLRPVDGEPVDVDDKGVDGLVCAQCHSTLDPLSYAFAPYEGLLGPAGSYDELRPVRLIPDWSDNTPVLLGQEVSDVPGWAFLAANSDEFARNLADIFFRQGVGRGPLPHEQDEFDVLWIALPADGYSVNRMLHRLIDTDAMGVP